MNRNALKEDHRMAGSVEEVVAVAIIELLLTEAAPSLLRTRNQSQGRLVKNALRKWKAAIDQARNKIGKPDYPEQEAAFDC
jgi:type II secretory pathway pseudopilin PulG